MSPERFIESCGADAAPGHLPRSLMGISLYTNWAVRGTTGVLRKVHPGSHLRRTAGAVSTPRRGGLKF